MNHSITVGDVLRTLFGLGGLCVLLIAIWLWIALVEAWKAKIDRDTSLVTGCASFLTLIGGTIIFVAAKVL